MTESMDSYHAAVTSSENLANATVINVYNNITEGIPLGNRLRHLASVTLCLVTIAGFVLNLLILIVIQKILEDRMTIPNVLVRALSVTDLLNCFLSITIPIIAYSYPYILHSQPVCDLSATFLYGLSVASQFIVAVMSIERFLAVIYPFKYHSQIGHNLKKTSCFVVALTLYSTLVALLPVFGLNKNVIHYPNTWCMFDFRDRSPEGRVVVYLGFLNIVIALVVIVVANTAVASRIRQPKRRRQQSVKTVCSIHSQDAEYSCKETHMQVQFTKLTVSVAVGLTMCWLLFAIRILTNQLGVWMDDNIDFIAARLMTFNSVINPLLYIAICKPYRKGCWVILRNIVHYVTCTSVKKLDMTLAEAVA
ncbi:PTGIR [Branchiostoma lanceolatum]|uniref:PTGIR protein n=1 Tax=Branchiostoma lanceolatum TaxID=7740 RepID=A0A8J9VXW7_BRALA|nr:PTGIR [Branchiostoma lanceolatum]